MLGSERTYIDIREKQMLLLAMLEMLDELCDAHSIRYSLDAGTLLGAVRHKGFIPWDDDVDVLVPRPDFDELAAHPEWLPNHYRLETLGQSGGQDYLPFAKITDLRWRAQEPALIGFSEGHLWLDVFPADAVPDDDSEVSKLLLRQKRLHDSIGLSVSNIDEITPVRWKALIKKCVVPVHRLIHPYRKEYELLDANARAIPFGSTNRIGNITWSYYRPQWLPSDEFDRLTELDFEGRRFKAVSCWDSYLTQLYGNYMKLPPESERRSHETRVWASELIQKQERSQRERIVERS